MTATDGISGITLERIVTRVSERYPLKPGIASVVKILLKLHNGSRIELLASVVSLKNGNGGKVEMYDGLPAKKDPTKRHPREVFFKNLELGGIALNDEDKARIAEMINVELTKLMGTPENVTE